MDYGRYKYEQKKKKSSQQSHTASLKEVKMRPGTDQHDLDFKLGKVRKFLLEGDKVKITVMFRGREMVHTDRGRTQLQTVMKQLGPLAKMENPPRMEGRFMSMIVVGEREAIAEYKKNQEARAAEAEGTEPESDEDAKPADVESAEPEKASEAAVEDGQG
jgi:translation initiation factor IF-3